MIKNSCLAKICLGMLFFAVVSTGEKTGHAADATLENQFPSSVGTASTKFLNKYQKQLTTIQQELARIKIAVPAELSLEDDDVAFLLDAPFMGQFRSGRTQNRFLVGRLVVLNKSDQKIVIKTKNIKLLLNGKQYNHGDKSDLDKYARYTKDSRTHALTDLKTPENITIAPGKVSSVWVTYNGLPAGTDIPNITILGKVGNKPFSLDASLQHRALLRWHREQIGPHGVIALCRIDGEVNMINLGAIIDDLVTLATKNITRVIITFGKNAPKIDSHLMTWFSKVAKAAGTEVRHNSYSNDFPILPAMIRELHLSNIPSGTPVSYSSVGRYSRTHKNLNDAIVAISQSAFESITIAELVKEIRSGNELTRPAALMHGSPRIPFHLLPDVIALVQQKEKPLLQTAALVALGEVNHPDAIAALSEAAKSESTSVSETALRSLGASRFPSHQNQLKELLNSPAALQQRVVKVLAQFPRKQWTEILYEHATSGPVALRVESLKALDVIGHPQLNETLISLLMGKEKTLQQTAYEILSKRGDRESRNAVIRFAIQKLESGQPDAQTFQVLTSHKVQQAIPGLLKLLKTDEKQRSTVIATLAAIGNDKILDAFVDIYPKLTQSSERVAVLQAIRRIDQHRFLKIAPSALKTKDVQIISNIASLLREISNEQAVDILIETVKQCDEKDARIPYLVPALGNLSTPKSRDYLIFLRDTKPTSISQHARNALVNIYARSPVSNLKRYAERSAQTGKHDLAIKQYTLAVEGDSYYPYAFEGRALSYRALGQDENALKDYNRLLKLDPQWAKAQGRKGQTLTSLSRFEEAVKTLNLAIKQEPSSAGWYSSRGHSYSMLEKFELAETDYRKALELDPKDMTALTGVALSLAVTGKIEEAEVLIKKAHADFDKNSIFAYNIACTYARAAEYLQKHPSDDAEHKKKIDQLVEKSLDELDRSISLGYEDRKWAIADPDLSMLKENARFEKLLLKMGGGDSLEKGKSAFPKPVQPAAKKKSILGL